MRRTTALVTLVVLVGLLPLWALALVTGSPTQQPSLGTGATPVAVNSSMHTFDPTGGFLTSAPVEVGTTQAGVLSWIALLVLVGCLVLAFQFVDHLGGRGDEARATRDGSTIRIPSFLLMEDRRLVEYVRPPATRIGLIAVGALAWAAFALTSLFVVEGLTLARTQFLGLYFGSLLLTLALLVVTYGAYFVPHIAVVEPREHATERDA